MPKNGVKTTDETVKTTDGDSIVAEGTVAWESPTLTKLPAVEAELGVSLGADGGGHS